ncbi:MAG: hypothetical protein A2X12_02325 [Bacteroidetes bacterium GWE2_29_8]|nr:MAG: hypothetical protein A2X12_02325 [Bacteroidetes bacterium GWE2_29_8]OFY14602.1 MAG: hypothetical protein A2X02_05910 [Bacteroidetes bacterium GWF2_29_10]
MCILKKLLILFILNIISLSLIYAQGSSLQANNIGHTSNDLNKTVKDGKIVGQVIDEKTNETLIGVTIIVGDKKYSTATDIEGRYELRNIPPGTYNITYRFISYATKTIEHLKVESGQTVNMNVTLSESFSELGEIVVTAKMQKESINSVLNIQKNNIAISDGISAESIKKSSDKSTGDVLKRISGTSIQNNKFVVIRGLNDRYNIAMLNGSLLPSTEPDRKAFSFDMFPSALLDNMMVTKTASPDLPGEFSGGIIMLNTKDIPEENFFNFSIGTSYHSTSTFNDFYKYKGGKTDFLGFDDGTRKLPLGIPESDDFQKADNSQKAEYTKLFANDWYIYKRKRGVLPSQSYSLSTGWKNKVFKKDMGGIFLLTYNNSSKIQNSVRSDYDNDFDANTTRQLYKYNDTVYKSSILIGAIFNAGIKLNDKNKISLNNTFNNNAEDQTIIRNGVNMEQNQEVKRYALQYTSTQLFSTQLGGEHFIEANKSKLKWSAGRTYTKRNIPNFRKLYYYKNIDDADDTAMTAYVPYTPSPSYGGRFYSELEEKLYNFNADYQMPFKLFEEKQNIKIGYSFQNRFRDFGARVMGMKIYNPMYFNNELCELDPYQIFNNYNIGSKGFVLDEITNKSDKYNASTELHAGYLMFENKFNKVRMGWGVRIEDFTQQLNSFNYSNEKINIDTNYVDILPSCNFTYGLTDKSNIRISVSKTISRPEFREIAPFAFYDFNTSSVLTGEPTLYRTNVYNADFRFEIFPKNGQVFSTSIFYKRFDKPIEQIYFRGSGTSFRTYTNADYANNIGAELEFRKNMDFLGKLLNVNMDDFTLFSNFAYISSKVTLKNANQNEVEKRPLQGQSPYIINCGIEYTNKKHNFSSSLLYNKIGKRISEVGSSGYPNIYENPRNLVDFQISKKVFKQKGEVKLNISDILKNDYIFYQDDNQDKKYTEGTDSVINRIEVGTSISLSLSIKL